MTTHIEKMKDILLQKHKLLFAVTFMLLGIIVGSIFFQNYIAFADAGHAHGGESEVTGKKSEYPIVTVKQVQSAKELNQGIEASGEVLVMQSADIYPIRDGKVDKLLANVGSKVKQGQIVATLFPDIDQAKTEAEVKIKQAGLAAVRSSIPFIGQAALATKTKLESGKLFAEKETNFAEEIKKSELGQLEVKIKVATLTKDIVLKDATANTDKIEIQKKQLLAEIETKVQVGQQNVVASKQAGTSEMEKIDAQIKGLETQKIQSIGSTGTTTLNAVNDAIDAMGDVYFLDASLIRKQGQFILNDTYKRSQIFVRNTNEYRALEMEVLQFVEKFSKMAQEEKLRSVDILSSKALDITNRTRTLLQLADAPQELIGRLTKDLDLAIEHLQGFYVEVSKKIVEVETEIASLKKEKERIVAENSKTVTSIEGDIKNLENSKSQVVVLDADKAIIGVAKDQKLKELDAVIQNTEKEKMKILATMNMSQNERNAKIDSLLQDLNVLKVESDVKKKMLEIEALAKSGEIDALRGQIGLGQNVTAPFDGVITKRQVDIGESVGLDKPLYSIVNNNGKFIRFYITESDLAFVSNNKTITFTPTFAPSDKYEARIVRIAQAIDPVTRMILVEAEVNTSDIEKLLTHMTVRVQIPIDDSDLMVVPEQAITTEGESKILWVVNSDVKAEKKQVQVKYINGGNAYIGGGLLGKEWVIIKSPVTLTPALEVNTKL